MEIAARVLKWILGISIVMIALFIVVFYRGDLTQGYLEQRYFLDESAYLNVQFQNSDGEETMITIHYAVFGEEEDPVVVLLHGMFSSLHTFLPWKDALVEARYRVVLIDLPNHGLSGVFTDGRISTSRSAKAVHKILKTLEISKFSIGGNSMGGGVSWFYASEYHGMDGVEVESIVLIDAVYPAENQGGPPVRSLSQLPLKSFLTKMTPKFLMRSLLGGAYGANSVIEEETMTRYYELLRKEGRRLNILTLEQESIDSMTGLERLEIVRLANIPVLVLWGEQDSWISVDNAYLFQDTLELEEESLKIYSALGHVPMEENPTQTVEDYILFLEKVFS